MMFKKAFAMFLGLALSVGTFAPVPSAHAGGRELYPVTFDTTNRQVTGSFGSVFNDTTTSWIWCNLYNGVATCAASAGSNYVLCSSSATSFVNAVIALSSDSVVRFNYNTTGGCSNIQAWKGSPYYPKR